MSVIGGWGVKTCSLLSPCGQPPSFFSIRVKKQIILCAFYFFLSLGYGGMEDVEDTEV